MNALIVVAACNFDDVILGVFPTDKTGQAKAMALAKAVAKKPELRRVDHMANDTQLVRSVVFLVNDSTKIVEFASFDPGGKRQKKVKARA